ncbi:MAG: hypothetical protein K2G23_07225 [Muribaculaceae bacterium]|nr:hypothetical protein [Muribaculaceae bacterium]
MRFAAFVLILFFLPSAVPAKLVKDTLHTRRNDRIILSYDLSVNGEDVVIRFQNKPRIIPGDNLRKDCKGDLGLLKVVLFDRVGDFGKVKWTGISPSAFMVPSGFAYDRSEEGFHILGETTLPISLTKKDENKRELSFPLYVALYEKKQKYKLLDSTTEPLKVSIGKGKSSTMISKRVQAGVETEQIEVRTSVESEADNGEVTKALSSIQVIRQMLASESELPFSQALQMEIYGLRSLKESVNDPDVIDKINEVLLLCSDKERELKESQKDAAMTAQAQEAALVAQQKAEEAARQKEAEEKARIQEEKQQKRTLWMIIGGVILGVLGFIGNAILKHFRDVRNRKSIMEMQESIAKQAEYETSRRSKEIVRNSVHKAANKGRTRVRESLNKTGNAKNNSKRKSI